MRIPGPFLLLLLLVLITGSLLSMSFSLTADEGDFTAQNRVRITLIFTLLLSAFILLAGSARMWHPPLWKHGNSQRKHRQRHGLHDSEHHRHRRGHHSEHHRHRR
jgi:hypothetical protein